MRKKKPPVLTKKQVVPRRKTYQTKMIRAMNKRIGAKDAIPKRGGH
jgi:hypothetical protein